jgi:RNA polymerase sigma factor (TIGR02999 family)
MNAAGPQANEMPQVRHVQDVFEELRASGKSSEEIFVTVYQDLKQLARKMVSREAAGDSMHATRLLSDLWIRLFGKSTGEFEWESGAHFYHIMARAMRQLLIDHARRRRAEVRGSGRVESLDALSGIGLEASSETDTGNKNWFQERADETLKWEQYLNRLEHENKRQADIVELRIYGGLTEDECAEVLGVSSETITKEFRKAKARLAFYLSR